MSSATLALAKDLIARSSVTPEDAGCQALLAERLAAVGFRNEPMRFEDVDNLWAVHGEGGPLLVFAGHTDVVPTGDVNQWRFPPFEPTESEGYLYGRGAADMKGSLAAMTVAAERFAQKHPNHSGRLAFLITSDEEGDAYNGTTRVVDTLVERGERIDWAVVGEPSSTDKVGDVIKNGRRGSMLGYLTVKGIQGHVAYPHLASNPVHKVAPAIAELSTEVWDEGNDFFPPTSFQIANFQSGTGATNVIPGEAHLLFSFRFSTEVTAEQLQQRVHDILAKHDLEYELRFEVKGQPFLTERGALVQAATQAVQDVMGFETQLSTAGGTSDGRFIAPTGAQVVELGPVNATIHKVDECVAIADLDQLTDLYLAVMENLLGSL